MCFAKTRRSATDGTGVRPESPPATRSHSSATNGTPGNGVTSMTDPQKLIGLNKKVIEVVTRILHENQMDFTDMALLLAELRDKLPAGTGAKELSAIAALLKE